MRTARGGAFVMGKSVGAEERAMALEVFGGGVCWTRQVEMLFTANVSVRRLDRCAGGLTQNDTVTGLRWTQLQCLDEERRGEVSRAKLLIV